MTRRSKRYRTMAAELLETRRCLAGYDLKVLARTGEEFADFQEYVSINDHAQASFIATKEAGNAGVYVADPSANTIDLVSFTNSASRSYGVASSIATTGTPSSLFRVAAADRDGPTLNSEVRLWSKSGFSRIAATFEPPGVQETESFDAFTSFVDANDAGEVAFVGIDTEFTAVHKLRVRSSGNIIAGQDFLGINGIKLGDFPTTAGLRPQLSNTTEVVFRNISGNSIQKSDPRSEYFRRVAGTQEGFLAMGSLPAVGRSPGISDDGNIITFFGTHETEGPGIYASLLLPGKSRTVGPESRMIFRVAGNDGELGNDTNGTPIRLTDFATFSSSSNASTTDSRVGVAGELDLSPHGISRFFVTFLANDPISGKESLWRVLVTVTIPGPPLLNAFIPEVSIGRLERLISVGEALTESTNSGMVNHGIVNDIQIYDPIANNGSVAFWAKIEGGTETIVLAPYVRRPVLLVPGIVGTFPKKEYFEYWLTNRGVHPNMLLLDPLAGFYNDMVRSLTNAGYEIGKDLFVVNYDWRMLPAPVDPSNKIDTDAFDGLITGVKERIDSIDSDKCDSKEERTCFSYGVDYLIYYLKQASSAWATRFPGASLDRVDIISHSTGGLVTRSYIQSDAYGANFKDIDGKERALPAINNFIMAGVPNRGAAKAWNPLENNFIDDAAFRLLLSKVIYLAYLKASADGDRLKPILGPKDEDKIVAIKDNFKDFIERYVPTIRTLLATYPFKFDNSLQEFPDNVNLDRSVRNNLLLDLNAGFDAPPSASWTVGDPLKFVELVGYVLNLYGENAPDTPVTVSKQKPSDQGEAVGMEDLIATQPKEVWYKQNNHDNSGDGTVPLQSSRDLFLGSSKRNLKSIGFEETQETGGDVSHTSLLSNIEIQSRILLQLGNPLPRRDISTGLALRTGDWGVRGETFKQAYFGRILLDPVDAFLVDGMGRRLGFSRDTGVLAEIPGSEFFGGSYGIGWLSEVPVLPLSLELTGSGDTYYVELVGPSSNPLFSIVESGTLAVGEKRILPVIANYNKPPVAVDDQFEVSGTGDHALNVLNNDTDPEGDPLTLESIEQGGLVGAIYTSNNQVIYSAPLGFEGVERFSYTVKDRQGAKSTAIATINFPGRPRIVAIDPGPNKQITSLRTITIDFSHPMELASVRNVSNYKLLHEDIGLLPITSVAYTDASDRHRATLTLSAGLTILPGRVHIQVDGRALRTITGISLSSNRDDLLVVTPDNNEISFVGLTQNGSYQINDTITIPGLDTPRSIDSADFNLDGFADVVSVSAATGQLVIYLGQGEGAFEPPTTITLPAPALDSTVNPQQVKVADWNGDLLPDLLVYDASSNKRVLVYLNGGQGKFSIAPDTPIPLSSGDYGTILGIADFTGDGLTDIAVAGSGSGGSIAIYGKDRFLGYTRVSEVSSVRGWLPTAGVMGDFNKDGKVDLAVSNTGYYLNNPGTVVFLSAPTGLESGRALQYDYLNEGPISVGDFTGDGNLDLAILHDFYRNSEDVHDGAVISVVAGDGHGNFNSLPNQILGRRGLGLASAGDMNGDGKLDLVLTASPWPENYIGGFPGLNHYSTWSLKGDGQGRFTPLTLAPIPLEPVGVGGYSIAMGDFDGDNALDLIAASPDDHGIRLLLNDNAGVLRSSPLQIETGVLLNTVNYKLRSLADVNSDGLTDLITLAGNQLIVFLGAPNGKMESQFAVSVPGSNGWIQTGDLNNDGNLDIVAQTSGTGVVVLLGRGNGEFVVTDDSPFDIVGFEYIDSSTPGTIADLNGDGQPDLLVRVASLQGYHVTPTGWAVYFGDGKGSLFFNRNTYLAFPNGFLDEYQCTQSYPLAVRDFDSDGKVDFLVSAISNGSTSIIVYHGNGNGTFAPSTVTSHPLSTTVCGFHPTDFNGDGNIDVIGHGDYSFELFVGDGKGHYNLLEGAATAMHEFKNTSNGSSNYRFGRVAVGDFNGDGSRDIALTKTSSWSYDYNEYIRVAALFMNDGTGHFQTGYFVSLAGYPDTMQGVAFNRWVEGGVVQIVPFLWPVNVTSPDVLSINNQMLTGTGPSQAMIYVKEGDKEMGQTTVGADGRWSYIFSPGLSEGYHSLRLFASDPEGRVSAEKQFTILVKDASRWQNSRNPLDVDNDQTITPLDVLSVVNYINAYGAGLLPTSGISPPPYYDVDADGSVSPLDVLSIVNYLNQQSGSGEGESSSISAHESTFSEESPPCEALYTDSDFDRVFASKDLFDSIGQDLYQKMRFFRKLRR